MHVFLRVAATSARLVLALVLAYMFTAGLCLFVEKAGITSLEVLCGHNAFWQIVLYFIMLFVAMECYAWSRRGIKGARINSEK